MRTHKLKIPYTEQLDVLNEASASVWNECLNLKAVNGRGNPPLQIPLPKSFNLSLTANIVIVNLVYTHGEYELHFVYNTEKTDASKADGVVGVDIGEIHPIVSHDGQNTLIFNGRYIRSLYRLRNKVLASMNAKIDRCQRHSRRYWHLVDRKWQRLRKIDNQIKDGLHQHTTKFVKKCSESGIGTIAIGDLTGIRADMGNQTMKMTPPVGFRLEVRCCSARAENVPKRNKRTPML